MDVATLIQRWESRQERYRSGDILVAETELKADEHLAKEEKRLLEMSQLRRYHWPRTTEYHLWMRKQQFRFEYGDVKDTQLSHSNQIEVFDGSISKVLFLNRGKSGDVYPSGFVRNNPNYPISAVLLLKPIIWTFSSRGLAGEQRDPRNLSVREEFGVFDNCDCVIVDYQSRVVP